MHGTRPANFPPLALALLLIPFLAGCSQAPLAANAEFRGPSVSGVERAEHPEAFATLTFTAAPAPNLDRLCLFVGRDAKVSDPVYSGRIHLVWQTDALAPDLQVEATGAHTATAAGGSPLLLEWTAETGPAALPFLVEVSLSGVSVAIEQAVDFLVKVDSPAPSIEILQGPCP